ncbi:MAG: tetratricopeptide repeat protein [Candidatus Kapabacteria bacterium]|jgi:Flp pilus assembly protein TadD|nr:tetratricopeptide repeat protein [Candidatus Kapabacteria bacterium]
MKQQKKARRSAQNSSSSTRKLLLWQALALVFMAFLLYGQTLRNGFMLDDRMVISENSVVKQGLKGIPTILTTDSFYGFDKELGRTGQRKTYRPLSLVMFAVEWQFFPNNPLVGHIVHVSLYAASGMLLLFLLRTLFSVSEPEKQRRFVHEWLPFFVTLLFVVHPIHTEVVCNIKSRDEILALLGMVSALWLLVKSVDTASVAMLVGSAVCCALGLLSKESAIGFLPVFPLALYFFRPALSVREILTKSAPLLVVGLMYLAVWFGFMGRVEDTFYSSTLTNPFTNVGFAERSATALWLVVLYIGKAAFPLTLSHSYTFNAIPVVGWFHWQPLVALVLCGSLAFFAVRGLPKRDVLAFCVLFFFSTIALVSNLFVYVGGLLGERFVFMPSVAAVLAIVLLAMRYLQRERAWVFAAVGIVCVAYSLQALSRIGDWQNEETLFKADAASTPQSYQAQTEYAKALLLRSMTMTESVTRQQIMREALQHLEQARAIDSVNDPQLYTTIALCYDQAGDLENALRNGKQGFERVLTSALYKNTPGYTCYAAKCYGQTVVNALQTGRLNDTTQAVQLLTEASGILRIAIQRDTPTVDADVPMTLANCYDALSEYDSALVFAAQALKVKNAETSHKNNTAIIVGNYGGSLMQSGQYEKAITVFSRGVQMLENNPRMQWGLGMALFAAGRFKEAVSPLRRAVELDPVAQRLKDDLARAEQAAQGK